MRKQERKRNTVYELPLPYDEEIPDNSRIVTASRVNHTIIIQTNNIYRFSSTNMRYKVEVRRKFIVTSL